MGKSIENRLSRSKGIRFPKLLYYEIERLANKKGVTFNEYIVHGMRKYIEKNK